MQAKFKVRHHACGGMAEFDGSLNKGLLHASEPRSSSTTEYSAIENRIRTESSLLSHEFVDLQPAANLETSLRCPEFLYNPNNSVSSWEIIWEDFVQTCIDM